MNEWMNFHNNPKVGTSLILFYREAKWYIRSLGVSKGHRVSSGKAGTHTQGSIALLNSGL